MRNVKDLLQTLLEEGYRKKTWHGPNLLGSLRGVNAKIAARRPAAGFHNIWELALHSAYWKYAVRRRMEGKAAGTFPLKGHNFFTRPERGKADEKAWKADRDLLEQEHRELRIALRRALEMKQSEKTLRMLYGVAMHDVYHAGQIRLIHKLVTR